MKRRRWWNAMIGDDSEPPPMRPPGSQKVDAVVEKVRADLLARSQLGIAKYGTTLAENPAGRRERIQHAYEEALDLANYLAWELMRLDGEICP